MIQNFADGAATPADRVGGVLSALLERFESADFPECVAYAVFPMADVPAAKWSLGNRILMVLAHTSDARGFRQWQEVGRFVKKGVHAFRILVPRLGKKSAEDSATGEEEIYISGFLTAPVFRAEDTDGKPLDYESRQLPEFPLIEKARELGICLKSIPGNARYYGFFSPSRNEIRLATEEEIVFFHELAHAVHYRVCPDVTTGPAQRVRKEIVAELAAAALCVLVGRDGGKYIGNSYHYIKSYAAAGKKSLTAACFQVLGEVEKVLRFLCDSSATVSTPDATQPITF